MTSTFKEIFSRINILLGHAFGYKLAKAETLVATSRSFINKNLKKNACLFRGDVLELGAAPSSWLRKEFGERCHIRTFDQFPNKENVDIVGNIAELTKYVPLESFDTIICTEVMEHVSQPFESAREIHKALKPGGTLLASAPFIYEIHGENYGDFWRITRQGWKLLLKDFNRVEITWLGNELRPKHYFIVATK